MQFCLTLSAADTILNLDVIFRREIFKDISGTCVYECQFLWTGPGHVKDMIYFILLLDRRSYTSNENVKRTEIFRLLWSFKFGTTLI